MRTRLEQLECENSVLKRDLQNALEKLRQLEAIVNEPRSDEEIDYGHIIRFWEEHTAPGNPHHSIHEWLEWLWSRGSQLDRLRAASGPFGDGGR